MTKHFLFVSDFDQTLSSSDAGRVLSETLGIGGFDEKVAGLSRLNLVQSGAELTYLLRHDPEFRRVRRTHLTDVGRQIRLKRNIRLLPDLLQRGVDDYCFDFYVVSAAPEEIVHAALEGIVPANHIVGTRLGYEPTTGEIASVDSVSAGYGKVTAVEHLRTTLGIPRERVIYVGDGSSDLHVMLHVNRGEGLTIAVSQARHITEIARRTVMSDDALAVFVPVLEEIVKFEASRIRAWFEQHGLVIQEWDRIRTDWVTIRESTDNPERALVAVA